MSKLGVQNPITAGQAVASYNASSVNDTNWHTLNSSDFYDSSNGSQFASNLEFAYVAIMTDASDLSFFKLRSADSATDGKTNADGVIAVFGGFDIDTQAIQNVITSVAYAKASASDKVVIYAGFNK